MSSGPSPAAKARRPVTVSDHRLAGRCLRGRVVLIDDDPEILAALAALLDLEGYACETHTSALAYLEVLSADLPAFPGPCCVLSDVKMPELDGLELQRRLAALDATPLLLMSGKSGVTDAVSAFRGGALDFLVKPIDADVLLDAVVKALAVSAEARQQTERHANLVMRMAALTAREREVARRVARGQTNPAIAADLNVALRTIKLYRQHAMEKLGAGSLAELVRIADELGM